MVHKTNDSGLQEYLKSHPKIVIKFYANWCGVCRLFASKFTKDSNKNGNEKLLFLEINAEENPWARNFVSFSNLPFLSIVSNGQVIEASSTSKIEYLESMIERLKTCE
jgi:thiol-disulfide isomerase/thioredoxin